MNITPREVRRRLAIAAGSGRLLSHRVRRRAIDGTFRSVPGYRVTKQQD